MDQLNTNEELKFPIYQFILQWSETADTSKYINYPNWTKDLPTGWIWNSTSFNKMYKENQSIDELTNWLANEYWPKYTKSKRFENKEFKLKSLEVKYIEHEVWNLTWFSHETFDLGQTDSEILISFENFVQRKENLNAESRVDNGKDVYCLMGAEDRWRWYGFGETNDIHTPPPCRCIHCKESGLIRINH